MMLKLYSWIMRVAEWALSGLYSAERPFRTLRVWAWTRATKENLRQINTRTVAHRLS